MDSDDGEPIVAVDSPPTESGAADTLPTQPIATITPESIAPARMKFEHETTAFGAARKNLVILSAFPIWMLGSEMWDASAHPTSERIEYRTFENNLLSHGLNNHLAMSWRHASTAQVIPDLPDHRRA